MNATATQTKTPIADAITVTYWNLRYLTGNEWIGFADLRADLAFYYTPEEFDAGLRELSRKRDKCTIAPAGNLKGLTAADREAAWVLGGQAQNMITFRRTVR